MDAYSRHLRLVHDYQKYYLKPGEVMFPPEPVGKTDKDILRENWRFLRTAEDDADAATSWEKRMSKAYYDRLFKEYCLADLKLYKEGRIAMRWRAEKEVFEGKGQFICGSVRCQEKLELRSWEVNFGYIEDGEKKNALVKLRLCADCSVKLNYRKQMREASLARRRARPDHTPSELGSPRPPKFPKLGDTPSDFGGSSPGSASLASGTSTPVPPVTVATKKKPGAKIDVDESTHWSGPASAALQLDKSREEEYDEYFQDMML